MGRSLPLFPLVSNVEEVANDRYTSCGKVSGPQVVARSSDLATWPIGGLHPRLTFGDPRTNRYLETCPWQFQGHFFNFRGDAGGHFGSTISDHLDTIQMSDLLPIERFLTFGDRVRLRADLGQSQPGNSSLSPQACRVENTTAELAVSEILPITSVHAPRYFGGRSLTGREGLGAEGGRTDRWPQITAIQSRTILLFQTYYYIDNMSMTWSHATSRGNPHRGRSP